MENTIEHVWERILNLSVATNEKPLERNFFYTRKKQIKFWLEKIERNGKQVVEVFPHNENESRLFKISRSVIESDIQNGYAGNEDIGPSKFGTPAPSYRHSILNDERIWMKYKIKKIQNFMTATAWNNGAHHETGAGYGLKISRKDRDRFFRMEWKNIILELEEKKGKETVSVNTMKKSFWNNTCRELINMRIGLWLIRNGKAPWPMGNPPKIRLEQIEGNRFRASFK